MFNADKNQQSGLKFKLGFALFEIEPSSVGFHIILWNMRTMTYSQVAHHCPAYISLMPDYFLSLEQLEMYRLRRGLAERSGRSSISCKQSAAQQIAEQNIEMWTDSPWPARNHHVFGALNSFMERCNDVLELVQTTTHFKMLRLASEIGGAGGTNLNSLVEEIYSHFQEAIEKIQAYNLVSFLGMKHTGVFTGDSTLKFIDVLYRSQRAVIFLWKNGILWVLNKLCPISCVVFCFVFV